MISSIKDCATLNNGLQMPWLGFGVFKVDDGHQVKDAIKAALEAGYRHIDTAMIYENERGVGNAIRESGIPREEIFVTTKVWNDDQRKKRVQEAFNDSLKRLGMDYVDLYLIHWPVKGYYQETWKEMEKIYQSGRAKAIGVSNFMVHHLEDILRDCTVVPAVDQVEFHPLLVQPKLLQYCRQNKVQLEGWGPLMRGHLSDLGLLTKLAEKYHKTVAQIILRWDLQHEVVTIPKSITPSRIIENTGIYDFELSAEDMAEIDGLDVGKRFGPDPETFTF